MRITLIVFILLFSVSAVNAEIHFFSGYEKAENPFLFDRENQIFINIGQGIAGTWMLEPPKNPVPYNMLQLQYSQPIKFFRLPSRLSANYIQTIGYGVSKTTRGNTWNWQDYTTMIAFLSVDSPFVWTNKLYFGSGIGTGIQAVENERIDTKFLLGLKIFIGYAFLQRWRLEAFFHHFSNGSTSPQNYSYNFYGFGVGYNF